MANQLQFEKSPYLRQHADNPVNWFPWGKEAFDKSLKEHKPIFLSIGYSTCHWCHVMAHESFEDPDVAAILNQYFISIKLDREERPDLDHIYMNAVIAITGQGGWPLSVFLKPDGKPFYGGTYFPPQAKWGSPGFKDLLLSMRDAWDNNKQGIETASHELVMILQQSAAASKNTISIDRNLIEIAVKNLNNQYDKAQGGFSIAPKFPMGHTLSFLLAAADDHNNARDMVEHTLTTMAYRGIHDQIASGYHRYATDQEWQVPHFEKMLYDQALLVMAYAQGYQVTGNALYANIARSVSDYVLSDMTSPQGAFYCAYDADSDGQEGAYYVFTDREIVEQLGETNAHIFKMYFDIKPEGNVNHDPHGEFTGKNILFQTKEIDPAHKRTIDQSKAILLKYRQGRLALHLDDKVLTDWNGLIIMALSFAGAVLNERRYIDKAKCAADFILNNLMKDNVLCHRWHTNTSEITGMLDDYAYLALGLTYLYEATLELKYLEKAELLVTLMIDQFEDKIHGGFYMSRESDELIVRPIEIYDGAMPSGNSAAAFVLMKLFFITDKPIYESTARRVVERFLPTVSKAPQGYTFFLQALNMLVSGPVQISITGSLSRPELVELQKIVYKCFIPNLAIKVTLSKQPWVIQVCQKGVCGRPVANFNLLLEQLT